MADTNLYLKLGASAGIILGTIYGISDAFGPKQNIMPTNDYLTNYFVIARASLAGLVVGTLAGGLVDKLVR